MARMRMIKPKFWEDTKIGKLSRDARLLYIALWNFSDDLGVVIGNSVWLKTRIFPYDQMQIQQFEKLITDLAINGFIYLFSYQGEEFIYLPNFARHQTINRPNLEDVNIPKTILDNLKRTITEQSLMNHGIITDESVTKEEVEKEVKDKHSMCASECDEEFERFWDIYSKKVGKKDKIKAKFLKLSKADRIKIFETLPDYVASTPDSRYRKNPETYLNNESWNDEIINHNGTRQVQTQNNRQYGDLSKFRDENRHYSSESDF